MKALMIIDQSIVFISINSIIINTMVLLDFNRFSERSPNVIFM